MIKTVHFQDLADREAAVRCVPWARPVRRPPVQPRQDPQRVAVVDVHQRVSGSEAALTGGKVFQNRRQRYR